MCGRYFIDGEDGRMGVEGIVGAGGRRALGEEVKTSGEVFPSDRVPVIASSRGLRPSTFAMRWGYAMPDGRRIINARSETAGERAMFADGMKHRRCAIPVSWYFEWERAGGRRTKYAIRPKAGEKAYLAGIYRVTERGPEFAVLTREPAEDIAFIHNRMPVILPEDSVLEWIDPRSDVDALLGRAVREVAYRREDDGTEQMKMEL